MKRLGVMILITTMMFQTVAFAEDAKVTTTSTSSDTEKVEVVKVEPKAIQYEEAVKLLLENNKELKNLEKQIGIQKEIIIEVDEEATRLKDFVFDDEDKITNRATNVYVDPIDARNTLNTLERSLKDKKFELEQSVLDYYVNWGTTQNNLSMFESVLSVYQKEYDQKSLELSLGKLTENDLLTYKVALDSAQKDIDAAKRENELTLMDFNYLINNNLQIQYLINIDDLQSVLKGDYIELDTIDVTKLAENNIANDTKLASLKDDIAKYDAQKRVERIYSSSASALKNFETKINDNEYDTNKRIKEIKYAAYTDLYNLKDLGLAIKIAENNVTLAKSAQNVAKVKFNLGMVTQLDSVKADQNVKSAENTLTTALNTFYKAYHDYLRFY